MKVRTGFVSNSSSSSFVIRLKSNNEVFFSFDVAYGGEEGFENAIKALIEKLGHDPNDYGYGWED